MGKYQDPDTRRLLWCTQDERVCFWEDDCLPWRNNEATQQWYNKATQQWFRELQVPIVATATQTSVSNRRWLWVDTSDGQPRWGPSLVLADLPSETPQVPQSLLGYSSPPLMARRLRDNLPASISAFPSTSITVTFDP